MAQLPLNQERNNSESDRSPTDDVTPIDFRNLLRDAANGDADATRRLVRQYEPELRRFIRFRLTDPQLLRLVDSVDITQSVFARFFVRLTSEQLVIENSQHLLKLLTVMSRNRLLDHFRKQHARRNAAPGAMCHETDFAQLPDRSEADPAETVCTHDLVQAIQHQLTESDRTLVNQRLNGKEWSELAIEYGVTADALRKRCTRAIDQAAQHLGLLETVDG